MTAMSLTQMSLVIIQPVLEDFSTIDTLNHLGRGVERTARIPMPLGFGGLVLALTEDDRRGSLGVHL